MYQSKTTCLPSGKNQSQCVMKSSIMLLMVPLVTMFGLLNNNLRCYGLHNSCTNIKISVCVIYHCYSCITCSTITYFKVSLFISILTSIKTYPLSPSDQRRFGPITMAMLLGVILFSSDFSANLAKNLIKYLKQKGMSLIKFVFLILFLKFMKKYPTNIHGLYSEYMYWYEVFWKNYTFTE